MGLGAGDRSPSLARGIRSSGLGGPAGTTGCRAVCHQTRGNRAGPAYWPSPSVLRELPACFDLGFNQAVSFSGRPDIRVPRSGDGESITGVVGSLASTVAMLAGSSSSKIC